MDWSPFHCLVVLMLLVAGWKIDSWLKTKQWPMRRKAVIVFASVVALLWISGLTPERGFPSESEIPNDFIFVHGVVNKPTKNDPGVIYIWIRTADDIKRPRVYAMEYDEEMDMTIQLSNIKVAIDGEFRVADGVPITMPELLKGGSPQPVVKQPNLQII